MKRVVALLMLLLSLCTFAKAESVSDTSHTKTPVRIILPEDTKGWVYYFYIDGQGHPPVQLDGRESTMTVSTNKKSFSHAHIYATSADQTKQTNKFSLKLTGRPVFLVIKGTNGIAVSAKKASMNKYAQQRMNLPEAKRAPWVY